MLYLCLLVFLIILRLAAWRWLPITRAIDPDDDGPWRPRRPRRRAARTGVARGRVRGGVRHVLGDDLAILAGLIVTDAALYAAIQADPTAAAFAATGCDASCAERLRAILPPVQGEVSARDLLVWGASSGARAVVEAHTTDATAIGSTTVGAVCLSVLDLIRFGGSLDTARPENQAMLAGLVTAGVFTQPQVDALNALGQSPAAVSADDVSRVMLPHRPGGTI